MEKSLFLLVLVALLSPTLSKVCVTQFCSCTDMVNATVDVKCRLTNLTELRKHFDNTDRIHSLDLSSNQLKIIPEFVFRGFSNVKNLTLADNDLEEIGNASLSGLKSLLYLNLANNKLRKWNGNLSVNTPELETINMTGNYWLPSNNVLELKYLRDIGGVTWTDNCAECCLSKETSQNSVTWENLRSEMYYIGIEGDCRAIQYTVSKEVQTFAKYGFYPKCLKNDQCKVSVLTSKPIHRCWDTDNNILNVEYLIAPISLALNIIVMVNTLTDRHLRGNVALLLVTNMAASDILLTVYTLVLVSVRKIPYEDFLKIMSDFCPVAGFLWLVAQIVTITTSVLLTIERYLTIVYCMNPAARLRRKEAIICLIVFWVIATIIAILPTAGIGVYTSNTYCVPVRPLRDIPHMLELGVGIGSVAVLLYLATIPLYVHIYIYVVKSKQGAPTATSGKVLKDFCLARRIAIMVFSNMLFFCIPVSIGLLWLVGNITKGMSPIAKEIITGVIPTLCFSLNALINPLLYAFRNHKFMHSLQTRLQLCRKRTRTMSLTPVSSSRLTDNEIPKANANKK
ncbi:lutropin-choriogonadotropic hormone receptor [Nematostella vectensis]|uniref:lutropin-choriogonadotropic hormone receptor n=1 Tax=Nematostella vectensis TaxID=45351 RepID=UPI002076D7FE|nr:lutropin-choriogonadotropic hormone receptor [Nematostella vectensis]